MTTMSNKRRRFLALLADVRESLQGVVTADEVADLAAESGLSPSGITKVCRAEGISVRGQNWNRLPPRERACPYCGSRFVDVVGMQLRGPRPKYCEAHRGDQIYRKHVYRRRQA